MLRRISAAVGVTAMVGFAVAAPIRAQVDQKTVIGGRCQYSEPVARYRHETTLILCDTATVSRDAGSATLDFAQRSWGSMAQFTGVMAGNRLAVSRISLRGGTSVGATGTCEIFRREDGKLSLISCLAKAGSRSIAANFVPSRL